MQQLCLPCRGLTEAKEIHQKTTPALQWQSDVYDGQWGPGPIPKPIPFKYWNRMSEVRLLSYPFMGWGLFTLQSPKIGGELLPFIKRTYSKAEFKAMKELCPQFIRYILRIEIDVYQDRNVEHNHVANFINNSIGSNHISNVFWKYSALPRSWNTKEWDYTKTIAH
jgi:hypothetical protein